MSINFQQLTSAGIAKLKPYQPGKPIEALEREFGISNALKLASNENPLGPSPKGLAAAQTELGKVNFYPDTFALTDKLAKKLSVEAANITLGNGSNDVLDLIARVFLAPGRNAVFSEYAFAVYPISTQAANAECRVVKALPADHPDMPYGHDLPALAQAIDEHTGVVFIANPNNPTGTWFMLPELLTFMQQVPEHVIVVLDEAYTEYVNIEGFPSGLTLLQQFPNLIVTRTFSKIYGLAGLRIGYGVSHSDIADLLNRVRHPFNVNDVALVAATAALDDSDFLRASADMNRNGLKQLQLGFIELGLQFMPSVANFLTVDTGRDAAEVYTGLLKQGVIVRPLANYGLPQHLRITVGRAEDNLQVLAAFKSVIKS